MSYGIIRIQKMKAGHVKGVQIHDQREKDFSHTNKDIDISKSHLNVDLQNPEQISFTEKVRERIKSLALPKAIRKDAVVMCQCLITSDNEFFSKMNKEQQQKFFDDAFGFVKHRYGSQNIISATVHYDETTPHLHVNFVPVTHDGRLAAKDLFKKTDLHRLHDDFYKFNKSRCYNLERGETRENKRKHLEVEEFKIKTGYEDIKEREHEIQEMKQAVKTSYEGVKKVLSNFRHLDTLEGKKTITGQIKLSTDEYNILYAMAKKSILLEYENKNLKNIAVKYEDLKKEIDSSVIRRLETSKKTVDIQGKYNNLVAKYNKVVKYINERHLKSDFHQYKKELDIERQKEMEKSKEYAWDIKTR